MHEKFYLPFTSSLSASTLRHSTITITCHFFRFASIQFGNPKMTHLTFILRFNTRPCHGCDLPAYRTAITTMTSFRHDGVYYISERKGLWFCIGTMMTMVYRLCSRRKRYSNMFMMRLMMQIFHHTKSGEVRFCAFMRRGCFFFCKACWQAERNRVWMRICMYFSYILCNMHPKTC